MGLEKGNKVTLHMYLAHTSIWLSGLVANEVHKNGLPANVYTLLRILIISAIISLIMGFISGQGHTHFNLKDIEL